MPSIPGLRAPRRALWISVLAAATLSPSIAGALELARLDARPLRLDVTTLSLANWHADNRNTVPYDDRYGELLNRLNLKLAYWKLVAGVRLDTATFFKTPDALDLARKNAKVPSDPEELADLRDLYAERLKSRYRDSYYLGKAYLTYSSPALEVTAGDAYVSFGRGLVLSLRKQDELAVDTTLLGGKILARLPFVSLTFVGGVANPVRIDEATGQTLFPIAASQGEPERPVAGQDRLVGGRVEVGSGGPSVALSGVRLSRADTMGERSGLRGAKTVDVGGLSVSSPLPLSGSAYLEGALQAASGEEQSPVGRALYGSVSGAHGPYTALLELQHYRDFDALSASVDRRRVEAFQFLRYSAPPTTEPLTTDTRLLYFDRCVSGGRLRVDDRLSQALLVYATAGAWATFGERTSTCRDAPAKELRNDVLDLSAGLELSFDERRSRAFASGGLRRDVQSEDGALFYREVRGEVTVAKAIAGKLSAELDLKVRRRQLVLENRATPWMEWDSALSLRYSPILVAAVGFEATSLLGRAPRYFNATLLWRYAADSSVKLFVGQQRGALKCVSGVCREFPPFEGAKVEWVQRY